MNGNTILTKTRGSISDEIINSISPFTRQSMYDIPNFILGGYTTKNGNKDALVYVVDTLGNAAETGYTDSLIISNDIGDDEIYSIKYANEGVAFGAGYSTNLLGNKDFYFMRVAQQYPLDTSFTLTFGGSGNDVAKGLTGDGYQYWCMAGYSNSFNDGSNNDIYIVNYDDVQGTLAWDTTFGGTGEDIANDIEFDQNNGNYYIVGSTNSYGNGGKDVYIIKLDYNGGFLWEKTYGGIGDDEALNVYLQQGAIKMLMCLNLTNLVILYGLKLLDNKE